MTKNEGNLDRTLRVIAGVILIGLTLTNTIGVWGWLGVVLIATGAIGYCPVYPLLGMNTCSLKADGKA